MERSRSSGYTNFSRIQNTAGIERALNRTMEPAHFFAGGERPPFLLCDADAVLAGDNAAQSKNTGEEFIQRGFAAALRVRISTVHHNVYVDIPITRVTEAGNGQLVLALQTRGEVEQILQTSARHDDVFIEFGQPGVAQRIREFPPKLPDFFRLCRAERAIDEQRLGGAQNFFQRLEFAAH